MSAQLSSLLVKPAGPDCNLTCSYCFYLKKKDLFPGTRRHRMSESVLEALVRKGLSASGPTLSFCWQGGEPTLVGLPFFARAVELQERHGAGRRVANALQSNGLLLDDSWARFLARHRFLVGLSLDGDRAVHDAYRRGRAGRGSWQKTVDVARRLLDAGVEVNAVATVTDRSVDAAAATYGFFKELGLRHMQFIPVVERTPGTRDEPAAFTPRAERYGRFLCELFDVWLADLDGVVATTSVRWFDALFYRYVGLSPPECTLLDECGTYVVVEHDGSVYPCDFFVDPEWRLGNVTRDEVSDLFASPRLRGFGAHKAELAPKCRACPWLPLCRGGCPKDRWPSPAEPSYLCPAYEIFFAHAHAALLALADRWRAQQRVTPPASASG